MSQGQRFSLLYLDRNEPVRDSQRFRIRLDAFYWKKLNQEHKTDIQNILKIEAGIEIPYLQNFGFSISDVFKKNELRDVLDSITLIYQCLLNKNWPQLATEWKTFVFHFVIDAK